MSRALRFAHRSTRRIVLLGLPLAVLLGTAAAIAHYSSTGSGSATASVGNLSAATISGPSSSGASITITWTQQAALLPSGPNSGITYTVQRKLNGGSYAPIGSGPCSGSRPYGTGSCTDTVSASGTYTYQVFATFNGWTAASNELSVMATLDTTPPTTMLTFPVDGGSYNTARWAGGCNVSPLFVTNAICGTASDPSGLANVKVAIENGAMKYWDGSGFTQSSPDFIAATGTTSWYYGFAPPVDGSYTVLVQATDGVGNTTLPGSETTASFTDDTAAPSSTLTFPTTSGPFNATGWNAGASSKIAGTASDPGPGSGLANVKVSIQKVSGNYWNGSSFGSAGEQLITASGTGSWTLAFAASNFATTGGGDGSYTVRVYATDNAGNTQATATGRTFTYDNTAPTAGVTFPAASGIYNASGWTNGATTPCGTSGTICGQTTDATSGISGASSIALTITRSSNNTTWNGTSFASGTNAVQPTTYNSGTGLWTYTFSSGNFPADGTYSVAVNATDAAGNASSTSTNTFTSDNTAPVLTLTKLNGATQTFPYYTNAAVTSIGGACGTASGDSATVNWSVTGGATESGSTSCSSGSWSVTLPTQLSAEGAYTVSATQSDTAGNTGSSGNQSIVIDKTAPSPTLNSFTNNATNSQTPTFAGTAGNQAADSSHSADSNTVTVYVCSGTQASCGASGPSLVETRTATRSGTTWSIAATTLIANATYTAQAAQSDGAANTGTSSVNTFVVDTTAPTVTSVGTTKVTGTYNTGVAIPITVTFSEPVTVAGTPKLALNTSPAESASYTSGSGTNTLTFTYTIASGDNAARLDYASTSALTLNGGTIQDPATNNATLTLPATQGANDNLYSTNIVVDTTAPTVSIALQPGSDTGVSNSDNITNASSLVFSMTFSESVSGLTAASFSNVGTATGCSFSSLTGSGASYTITATSCSEGTAKVRLAASTVTDTAGNPNAQTDGTTVAIDRTAPGAPTSASLANGGGQGSSYINIANKSSVSVAVGVAENVSTDTVNVTISDGTHQATGSATVTGSTVTVTGVNASTLNDGMGNITISATETDAAGNTSGPTAAATTYNKDTVAPTVTGLVSANKTGGTAGQAEQGDSITLTFSEPILASSIPSSSNVVLNTSSGNSKPVTLGLAGLDSAALTIGATPAYLAKNSADVDFNASAVSEPAGNQIKVVLGTQSGTGTTTVGSSQSVTFPVSSSLTDVAGNPATGSFTTTILFF